MVFWSMKFYVYHLTLLSFHLIYTQILLFLEAVYYTYVGMVENVILPVIDALWSTKFQLVRIFCRLILAPHTFLLLHTLVNRHAEKVQATTSFEDSLMFASESAYQLCNRDGYCLPDLIGFIKAQLAIMGSGILLKITDGKRKHEQYLYGLLQSKYSRPLRD